MADFKAKRTLSEWSSQPPACVTRGISWMYIAWRGNDDTGLYIATLRLDLTGTTDLLQIDNYVLEHGQLDTHQFNDETSPLSPALAMLDGRLYIAWVGENNHWLNIAEVMLNADGSINSDAYGTPFLVEETDFDPDGTPHVRQHTEIDHRHIYLTNKQTLSPNTSSLAPCMTGHEGKVYLCWTGDDGDRKINVAVFDGNLSQLDSKPVFDTDGRPAATRYAPALLSAYAGDSSNRKSALILAWNSFYGEFWS